MTPLVTPWLKGCAPYAGAIALSCVILTFVLKLWRADWTVPLDPRGWDVLFNAMQIKTIVDTGWALHNPHLGMPFGLELEDFLPFNNLHYLIVKLLSYVSRDAIFIMNFYFLAAFPLTVLTSLFVFRSFSISYLPAIAGSIIFSFLPYHFLRGEAHLSLASYYLIPLTVMVILWISRGDLLFGLEEIRTTGKRRWPGYKTVSSVVICILVASSGVYYAFFAAYFFLIAGAVGSARAHSWRPLIVSAILTATLCMAFFVNISPSLAFLSRHGPNPAAVLRSSGEAEVFGLKIAQLLLPIERHRLPIFRWLRDAYIHTRAIPENENGFSSLGLFGSLGCLLLLGWLIRPRNRPRHKSSTSLLLTDLSVLNVTGVLLATIGGFGSIFALLVSPYIRAYNRISVYLGFFAVFAVVLVLEKLADRSAASAHPILTSALFAIILFAAILDQTSSRFVPPYRVLKAIHTSDHDFIRRIEASLPTGAMIFQLPYVPFPETPPQHRMADYDHFRAYLHSKALRWSYGAMKGRDADAWQLQMVTRPLGEMLTNLAFAGFEGVYLDRYGYQDAGSAVINKLRQSLYDEPLVSEDARLVFFNLRNFKTALRSRYSTSEWDTLRNSALIVINWRRRFWPLEGTPDDNWRWSSSESELLLKNPRNGPGEVTLQMSIATGHQDWSTLRIESTLFSETIKVNAAAQFFSKRLTIPPGTYSVRFLCDAPALNVPSDPRPLVFRVINFRLAFTPVGNH